MICRMNKRVAAVVALLGLAFVASARPAHAQDGDNWFEEPSAPPEAAPPAPAPPAPAPPAPPAPALSAPPAPTPPPAALGPRASLVAQSTVVVGD